MNSDSYFTIGKSHMVCQDYAYAGVNSAGNQVAIISDGCSGSPDTDFGSRYIVRSALICGEIMNSIDDEISFGESLVKGSVDCAHRSISGLNLSSFSLDATLFYVETRGDSVVFITAGDGVIFAKTKEGVLESWNIEYPSGFPYYPSYLLDDKRRKVYEDNCGTKRVITYYKDSEVVNSYGNNCHFHYLVLPIEYYDFVGVSSDGILTFSEVSMQGALVELTSFKNFGGCFVTRRVRRVIKQCTKSNTLPTDDVSMAVINLKDLKCLK